MSEAEVIRQALERESEQAAQPVHTDVTAWESIQKFVEARKAQVTTGEPVKWERQELYEGREARWVRDQQGE